MTVAQPESGPRAPLELWAGVECSVARVGDEYVDQLVLTGHDARLSDLDRLAALGARAIRYPVLWERTATFPAASPDFSWAEERLDRLRTLGLRPIIGLVHHGSGPRHTSLLDDGFAAGLAAYARQFSATFPWVTDFTPINEPLTTARFAGLYGHWYPHAASDHTFVRALLTECTATRSAMRAIREIRPDARLVQTEDFGTVFSTPRLEYQAHFENERRFLAFDLLTGRVTPEHRLYRYLVANGATRDELASFVDAPCPPDVIGVNYYVTSDRFLDDRVERYPAALRGGNGRHTYVDVEAVRVRPEGIHGHRAILRDAWERYGLPLAITESHLGCTPEEQIRWLRETFDEATEARARDGVDVRAVTAWSAFGACDWDSLLVRRAGHYEPGLFDVRGGVVRPTALVQVAADLARGVEPAHPLAAEPGWWRRRERFLHEPTPAPHVAVTPTSRRPVLVTGAGGKLGRAIAAACAERNLACVSLRKSDLDITDALAVTRALDGVTPWAVVNAAGYARIDDAEQEPRRCWNANVEGAACLARACSERGIRLVTFSSDLVFDGKKGEAYVEQDGVGPLGVYGRTKAEAERRVVDACPGAVVVRTSHFFGPNERESFLAFAAGALAGGATRLRAPNDRVISPTYLPDLAHAVLTLVVDGATGVWHLTNRGAVTFAGLARSMVLRFGLSSDRVQECDTEALGLAATRPTFTPLESTRGALLPPLDDALARFCKQWRHDAHAA